MGLAKIAWLLAAASVGYLGYSLQVLFSPPPLPKLPLDTWWGPDMPAKVDTSIRPFKVQFSNEMITDLKNRLTNYRKPTPSLENIGFQYGFNSEYIQEVAEFWKNKYEFKKRETFLNQFPQFVTNIQGLDIHYIHVKPKVENKIKIVPLLILHGWPGSVREFYEFIPLLITPRPEFDFVFEIIAPSLPGYGFSQAAKKTGLGAAEISIVMRNLMHRIGHKKFYIQGGDWGSFIGSDLSTLFPQEVLGYHTNLFSITTPWSQVKTLLGNWFPSLVVEDELTDRMYPISKTMAYLVEEMGYLHLQSTKPDTIGIALNDSPLGLAAYILEKFSTWTNRDFRNAVNGRLTEKFKLVDLLDNVMIYWSTGSITTSMRLYAETFNERYASLGLSRIPTTVPTAGTKFKHELSYQPDSLIKEKFPNLIQTTVLNDGGHFAALELPAVLADDLWDSTNKFIAFNTKKATKN